MAVAPSPEDVGRMILARFATMNSRAGHALPPNQITAIQVANQLTGDEMTAGLQYAGQQGWIEATTSGGLKLTDLGFSEM